MVGDEIDEADRDRRWRQLADLYLAQQLSFYPEDYVGPDRPQERLLETVERFEEDLTDKATVHGPIRAMIAVGEAIEVSSKRERGPGGDPLMGHIQCEVQQMLERLASEAHPLGSEP